MNIKLVLGKSLIQQLILLMLFLTPIYNFGEIIAYSTGNVLLDNTNLSTPIYIKLLKDFFFILIILIASIEIIIKKVTNKLFLFLVPILAIVSIVILINKNGIFSIASGIKWILPIFLIFFLFDKIDDLFLKKIGNVLFKLLWIHLIVQIFQLFFMPTFFGVSYFGLSNRNPGLFAMPSTASFFAILVIYFNFFYSNSNKKTLLILCALSVILTASGAGIAAMLLFFVFYFVPKRYYKVLYFFMPFILILFPILIIFLTGRSEVFTVSGMIRVILFMNILTNVNLFSTNFGLATNNASLLGEQSNIIATDSAISMILANFGLIPFALFLVFYFSWMFVIFYNKNKELICFSLIFSIFALTSSLTESFPGNILFAVLIAHYSPRIFKFS
jgi:hypothetical protein